MKSALRFEPIHIICIVLFVLAAVSHSQSASAKGRVALVIGNSAYQNTAPLKNPRNDAEDMAARLNALGFKVIYGHDLDKSGMDGKIAEFAEALSGVDVAVFFYGGHGLQVGGQNYLVPVDAKLLTARALDFEMVRLDLVQRAMERDAKTNIIFLDACRDNPLARNLARSMGTRGMELPRGLATVQAAIGTLISFSTQPGNVALDGEGRNSPFAGALVKHLGDGDSITDTLVSVRNEVVAETNQQQVPWEHSALRANFYFNSAGPKSSLRASAQGPAIAPASYDQQAELELWSAIDSKNPELLQSYLDQFPNGRFAETARVMIDVAKKKKREQDKLAEQRSNDAGNAAQQATAPALTPQEEAESEKRAADLKLALAKTHEPRKPKEKQKATTAPRVNLTKLSNQPIGDERISAPPEHVVSAIDLQTELKRVGCFEGEIDGKWGSLSRTALDAFAVQSQTLLTSNEPTLEALEALKAHKDRVCPVAQRTGRRADCAPIYGPFGAHDNPWCK